MGLTKASKELKAKRELKKNCIFPKCPKKHNSKHGLCNHHYRVQYRRKLRGEIERMDDVSFKRLGFWEKEFLKERFPYIKDQV